MKRYDHIEHVKKFNPYHGADGRFTTANGATSMTVTTRDPKKQHMADKAIERAKQKQSQRYDRQGEMETALRNYAKKNPNNPLPRAVGTPSKELHGEYLRTVDSDFKYPQKVKDYMESKYPNGYPKVKVADEWEADEKGYHVAQVTINGNTMRSNYPQGATKEETAQNRAGAIKDLILHGYNDNVEPIDWKEAMR